ncbi:acid phosphatase type 7-like [Tubulanus polymorphus]|uniref:acid phosphatase type 7-like n=1 Tax=Tubulanus polymorphus TaxID=672921 RepID=UPI003DA22582
MPEQVHISYGDSPTEMVVMWATRAAPESASILYYREGQLSSGQQAVGKWVEFVTGNENGTHFHHRVKLTNLEPGAKYFYSIQVDDYRSEIFTFISMNNRTDWTPNLLVYGDLGEKASSFSGLEKLKDTQLFSAVLHVGDFAYDMDEEGGKFNKNKLIVFSFKVGDAFMRRIQPIAAYLPYMTCPGNHEKKDDFIQYRTRFSTPFTDWPIPLRKMWYSFDMGLIHFIAFSTGVYLRVGKFAEEQRQWVISDLKKANASRATRPWIVAFGHRPMYCSNKEPWNCEGNNFVIRKGLEDIFYEYAVDVVIAAHEHSYERTKPVYKDYVVGNHTNPGAPIYLITGAAGNKEGYSKFIKNEYQWSAHHLGEKAYISYGTLQAVNKSHLHWTQFSLEDGALLDNVWIVQGSHGRFPVHLIPWHILHRSDMLLYFAVAFVTVVTMIMVVVIFYRIKRSGWRRYVMNVDAAAGRKGTIKPLLNEVDDDADDIFDTNFTSMELVKRKPNGTTIDSDDEN